MDIFIKDLILEEVLVKQIDDSKHFIFNGKTLDPWEGMTIDELLQAAVKQYAHKYTCSRVVVEITYTKKNTTRSLTVMQIVDIIPDKGILLCEGI